LRSRPQQIVGQRASDISPRSGLAFKITFGEKLIEGDHRSVARHSQFARQRARGRQSHFGFEAAREDRIAQCVVKLAMKRGCERAIKRDPGCSDYRRPSGHYDDPFLNWLFHFKQKWYLCLRRSGLTSSSSRNASGKSEKRFVAHQVPHDFIIVVVGDKAKHQAH
jgi:hypothetical protein